jgi:hypothetical protein
VTAIALARPPFGEAIYDRGRTITTVKWNNFQPWLTGRAARSIPMRDWLCKIRLAEPGDRVGTGAVMPAVQSIVSLKCHDFRQQLLLVIEGWFRVRSKGMPGDISKQTDLGRYL